MQANLWTLKKLGFTQQSQTYKFELSRAQIDFSHLRGSVERIQSTDTRDAEDLQNVREENLSLARGLIRNLGAAELETARIHF